MNENRHPRPLFAAAVGLPLGAALAAALFPEAGSAIARAPWAASLSAAAAFVLPLPLFVLAFRDLTRTAPTGLKRALFGLAVPVVFAAAAGAVVLFLEFGRGPVRHAAFLGWSLVCAFLPPAARWVWNGVAEALPAPTRFGLALSVALAAYAATLTAAAGGYAYAGAVEARFDACRAARLEESERLRRDRPRSRELDTALRSCESLRYRLALARPERPDLAFLGG